MCSVVTEGSAETVLQVIIQDPGALDSEGYPQTKGVLHVILRGKGFIDWLHWPESLLIDGQIGEMRLDEPFMNEKDKYDVRAVYNCARCGSPLETASCPECGIRFKDDGCRTSWAAALTPEMIDFLEARGFKFIINPVIAQEKAARIWHELHEKNQ